MTGHRNTATSASDPHQRSMAGRVQVDRCGSRRRGDSRHCVLDEHSGALRSRNGRRRTRAADQEDRVLRGGVRAMQIASTDYLVNARGSNGALDRDRGRKVARAFSSEVDTGSREENASKQKSRASVLIQSESIRAKTAGFGVPSSVPNWRPRHDSNV